MGSAYSFDNCLVGMQPMAAARVDQAWTLADEGF
jgi:hypothetical protein